MTSMYVRLVSVLMLALGACGPVRAAETATEDVEDVVEAETRFALDLYARLGDGAENVFYAPMSVFTALAMTSAGARGSTAEEMSRVLHVEGGPAWHAAMGRLQTRIGDAAGKGVIRLSSANALWMQQDFDFLDAFKELVRSHYRAELQRVNFRSSPDNARRAINAWVAEQTESKIEDLLQPGGVRNSTRLVLVNAVYFKGNWAIPFPRQATREGVFRTGPDTQVRVPMMRKRSRFRYAEVDGIQLLDLPYEGGELSMLILLPRGVDGLAAMEADLSAEGLAFWMDQLRQQQVDVTMPVFTCRSRFSLADTLSAMGMPEAFSGRANFSGMTGARDLFIGAVEHEAFVDVNEEGTEAAGATAVEMRLTAARPQEPKAFKADHPFVFLIRHNGTGCLLFLGRVADPS